MKLRTIDPTILTLLTTYRCTAACPNCCFNCSPKPKIDDIMSLEKMKQYISSAKKDFPSLLLVVFTGGECTLLGDDLIHAIKHAKSLGMFTRIVTNGHWGKDPAIANKWITSFVNAGLDEINFSTGDEHNMFVSLDTITYAISECARLDSFKSVFINIETLSTHNISEKDVLNSINIRELDDCFKQKIRCIKSPWIEFRNKNEGDFHEMNLLTLQRPCKDVLTSINITPTGQFLSCCGLASEYTPFLKLGQFSEDNLKTLHNSRFNDLLKLWLFSVGPYKILQEIGCTPKEKHKHGCEYCHNMLQNEEILKKLLSINSDTVQKIILDYNLIVSRYEKANKRTHR